MALWLGFLICMEHDVAATTCMPSEHKLLGSILSPLFCITYSFHSKSHFSFFLEQIFYFDQLYKKIHIYSTTSN